MEQYYFLFGLAFIWIIFAVIQDLRTREVSNWLNFSLISFVLAYRAFYSLYTGDLFFFIYGLIGVLLFVALGYLFYYGKVFAGGDAKLMMGLGGIFPYDSFFSLLTLGGGFVLAFFICGAIYTLVYSGFLAYRHRKSFWKSFKEEFATRRLLILAVVGLAIIFELFLIFSGPFSLLNFSAIALGLIPFLYIYVKAVEQSCMIKQVSGEKLTEGDWLEKEVKIGRKTIAKSVHGLSIEDINLIRRAKKRVWIKEGIPFTPAFLLAFIAFLLWYSPW